MPNANDFRLDPGSSSAFDRERLLKPATIEAVFAEVRSAITDEMNANRERVERLQTIPPELDAITF